MSDGDEGNTGSSESAASGGSADRNFDFDKLFSGFNIESAFKDAFKDIKFDGDTLKIGAGLVLAGSFDRVRKLADNSIDLLESVGKYGRKFYDPIQEAMGGLQNFADISNKSSKAQFDAINQIYDAFNENGKTYDENFTALQVRTATASNTQVNALQAYFKDAGEVFDDFNAAISNLADTQMLKINQMSKVDRTYLGTFEKGLGITSRKVGQILERTISLTGDANVEMFGEISNFSAAVAEKTGISYKQITKNVADIITDVKRFGNVQVDEAARIAGALGELGVSYETFGGMVDRFMNFDTAASSLGNLTTLFGVHFDAMEMMMLANEDQEEFLYRIREAFLETGKSIDDMTLAEKKLAAQELGMDVTSFENFMQAEREISDTSAETAAASKKSLKDGFETMTQNMVLVERSTDDLAKLAQQRVLNPMKQDAHEVAKAHSELQLQLKKTTEELKVVKSLQDKFQSGTRAGMQTDSGIRRANTEALFKMLADEEGQIDRTKSRLQLGDFDQVVGDLLYDYTTQLQKSGNVITSASYFEQVIKKAMDDPEASEEGIKAAADLFLKVFTKDMSGKVSTKVDENYLRIVQTGQGKISASEVLGTGGERGESGGAEYNVAVLKAMTEKAAAENFARLQQDSEMNVELKTMLMTYFAEVMRRKGGVEEGQVIKLTFSDAAGVKKTQLLDIARVTELELGTGISPSFDK